MRLLALSAFTSWLTRGASIGLNIAGLAIAHRMLSPEMFGALLVLSALGTGLTCANLGLSRTVMTHAARYMVLNASFARVSFRHACAIALVVYGSLLFLATALIVVTPWSDVMGLPSNTSSLVIAALILISTLTSLFLILSQFEGISVAKGDVPVLNLSRLAGYSISGLVVFGVWWIESGPFLLMMFALHSGSAIGDALNAAWLVRRDTGLLRGKVRFRHSIILSHCSESAFFVLMYAAFVIRHQVSVALVGMALGASSASLYGLLMRVLSVGVSAAAAAILPLRAEIIKSITKRHAARGLRITLYASAFMMSGAAAVGAFRSHMGSWQFNGGSGVVWHFPNLSAGSLPHWFLRALLTLC